MVSAFYAAILILFLQPNGCITDSATWPSGTYALLKPKTVCPSGWKDEGSIRHSTNSNNNNSRGLHIQGEVLQDSVSIYFCIKKISRTESLPTGQYCIYGKPEWRYHSGYIVMKDKNWYPENNVWPFVNKRQNSKRHYWYFIFYFQCYTSGNKKIPISLPITKPFYLLPYGSRDCQQVKWMVASSEWIKYDTGSYMYRTVPHHDLGYNNEGITMFYCYYESCNKTLKQTKSVFQSPGFPGKYPDGQLCSWRIMVPDNHTLNVQFTDFSLYAGEYDTDCLLLYENNGHVMKLKQAFVGHQQPFTITATRDVMLVFRSDEKHNSNGFRANYTMFKIPERTTTAKPPTTTTQPTTTTKPPTQPTTTQTPTTKQPTTTETRKTFPPTKTMNSTTNITVQCIPTSTKDKFHNKRLIQPVKKTCFCDENWKIVVMVIPLAVFILIAVIVIHIICRYRYKQALKTGASGSSADDGVVVNPTYERGNIILDQPADTVTDSSTVNTGDEQPQSRDEPPDYEDLDYTQIDEVPQPRRSTKRQECLVLEPFGNDTSSVFYHVLEPSKIESDGPQCNARDAVGNGAPDVFYHTLEPHSDSNRPTYQNLSELNHYTLNPVYEPAENSAPLFEANKLYDI